MGPTRSRGLAPKGLGAALAAVLASASAVAGQVQWSSGSGGNDHWYQAVHAPSGIAWADAYSAALGMGGYLATIQSSGENAFVFALIDAPEFWLLDGAGNNEGPWLGGYRESSTWEWVNGEGAMTYTNWASGEPNNFGGGEDRTVFFSHGSGRAATWNDVGGTFPARGYVVEYSSLPATVPEPGTLTLLGTGLAGAAAAVRRRRATSGSA